MAKWQNRLRRCKVVSWCQMRPMRLLCRCENVGRVAGRDVLACDDHSRRWTAIFVDPTQTFRPKCATNQTIFSTFVLFFCFVHRTMLWRRSTEFDCDSLRAAPTKTAQPSSGGKSHVTRDLLKSTDCRYRSADEKKNKRQSVNKHFLETKRSHRFAQLFHLKLKIQNNSLKLFKKL